MEGARLNYYHNAGMWDFAWQGFYGNLDTDLTIDGRDLPSKAKDIVGFSVDATRDWLSFRLGYTIAEVSIFAGLEALAPLFANPRDFDAVQALEDDGYFASAGVFIDYQDWLINAEIVQYEPEDSSVVKTDAYYAMLGRRFDEITLAYTYSVSEGSNDFSAVNSIPSVIPNPRPGTEALCGQTAREFVRNCVISAESDDTTHSLTFRWNFLPGAAFTADYTTRKRDIAVDRTADRTDKLFTVGVDLVF